MSDSVINKSKLAAEHKDPLRRLRPVAAPPEGSECEDHAAFGWLRSGRERALMLELRRRNGDILAIGYNWLERAEFVPSTGIILHASGQTISILGSNLNAEMPPSASLFQGLVSHRVPWVREASRSEEFVNHEQAARVDRIDW